MKLRVSNKINKFDRVPKFDETTLKAITNLRADFLKKIFPFLAADEFNDGCIELRPLWRGKDEEHKYIRSYNAWHMGDKDIENLYKFSELLNGEPYCLYYSLYAFDYHKKVVNKSKSTKDNTVYRHPWEINTENALFITALGVDFDNITIEKYNTEIKTMMLKIGLESIDIWTGHGVQAIFLLDKKYYDKELLGKFVRVMFQKGFPVDLQAVDCARNLRSPYGFNCKEFEKSPDNNPQAIITFVLHDTDTRYSTIDVFKALNRLPDIVPPDRELKEPVRVIQELELIPTKPFVSPAKPTFEKENTKVEFKELEGEYPLNFERLATPIKKMLSGTPEGLRNATMLFLIPFFKNAMKLSSANTIEIMKVWDKYCIPSQGEETIEAEVKRLWNYNYDKKFGAYSKVLQDYYGEMSFDEYKLDNVILIPNIFFKHLKDISDGAVQIYLSMLLSNKLDNKKEWTLEEIIKCADISKKTFYNNIDILMVCGFIDKVKKYKRGGEDYSYRINAYKYCVGDYGYTKVEVATIKLILKELTKGEVPLYLFLRYMITTTKDKCYASQDWIGQQLGKNRVTICNSTKTLNDKKYIKKNTAHNGIVAHSIYTLIY